MTFKTRYEEEYNKLFTITEMTAAKNNTKNTAADPDKVPYEMVRYLPEIARKYLLKVYNKLWTENYFPQEWKEAFIVAIPKPNKDHTKPENYRPIALTSCVCKILKK